MSLFAAVILTALTAETALGNATSATMQVSARVISRAVVTVSSAPDVVVTEADVVRGYVDLPEEVELQVRTNSRSGYLLEVTNTTPLFSSVQLHFGQTTMTVTEQGWVSRPYAGLEERVRARVRLHLAPGTMTGRHSLPVRVSASPL